ncbi:MAG TPA: PEGA domain-containing protein [Acidobacteriota bacterium]|nr:PEGA domain-containing protein [Acidobacteriota bacterium]
MRECPKCGSQFLNSFQYCPADGSPLGKEDDAQNAPQAVRKPAQIRVKTLMLGIAILIVVSVLAFAGAFFYQYWKPKYGGLIVKTTPPGAMISLDGKLRGASPLALSDLRSGGHQLRIVKEGYKEFVQQVSVMPYATESVHWKLEPVIPQLNNEQLAEVESWRKKLENAQNENILLPPPDDYNVLFFAQKILEIDPANSYAADVKAKVAETVRQLAEFAYAREDWLEAEKQYKNLALIFPNDATVQERLADVAAKLDASTKDREKQIQDWIERANAAMKAGSLLPPEKDNALDAIRSIQRLDKNNSHAGEAIALLKEQVQGRAEAKVTASDWQGARNDFKSLLQYFPEDNYSRGRLATVEAKIAELAQQDQQKMQRTNEEQQSRQKLANLRLSALNEYRVGSYQKSIADWQEYLKFEPNSDEAYFYLGANYQDQKQLDTAILNFEKCISLNPNNVLAHLNLGQLYDFHRNNFKQAEEHLRRAKELGGAEKYNPDKIQSMIQDLQDRAQANSVLKMQFSVEHKHAFSTCRGTLQFTEEGVEFRTTETDHSFYEAYKGLRGFAIQGNKLAITTRSNKKYNFQFLNSGDAERVRAWASSSRYIPVGSYSD